MVLYKFFATNLRSKVAEHGSIADVCRGLGINRQQFNKYMSGSSIPNAITLRKICIFLKVEERELFSNETEVFNSFKVSEFIPSRGLFSFIKYAGKPYDFEVRDLPTGNYECFMPIANTPGMLVRSLLVITQSARQKEFVRLTRFPSKSGSTKLLARGRHKGIVFASDSEIYFIAANRYPPYQISFMTMKRSDGTTLLFSKGTVMTHGFDAPLVSKFCLLYSEEQTHLKPLIIGLGLLHVANANLNPIIAEAL